MYFDLIPSVRQRFTFLPRGLAAGASVVAFSAGFFPEDVLEENSLPLANIKANVMRRHPEVVSSDERRCCHRTPGVIMLCSETFGSPELIRDIRELFRLFREVGKPLIAFADVSEKFDSYIQLCKASAEDLVEDGLFDLVLFVKW